MKRTKRTKLAEIAIAIILIVALIMMFGSRSEKAPLPPKKCPVCYRGGGLDMCQLKHTYDKELHAMKHYCQYCTYEWSTLITPTP